MNRLSTSVFILVTLSLSTLGHLHPAHADIPAIERAALIALYNSTDGDNWTDNRNWKEPPLHTDGFAMPGTENTWHGINCDGGNTYVRNIRLYINQLTGSIPPELGNLSNLNSLELSGNQLTGNIPPELGDLANLTELWLSSNQLTGSIPPELGNMVNLRTLSLGWNQLTGRIPTELMNLSSLSYLDICENHLYATDSDLRAFLDNLQPGWEDCQTPPYGRPMPWNPLLLLGD